MRMSCFRRSLMAGILLSAVEAQSQKLEWTHYGLRPLAMGNAFVAVADDYNALFYNPAGLARLKSWDGEFFNPTFEVSENTSAFVNDAQNLVGGSAGSETAVLDLFEAQSGQTQHLAMGITPHLIFRNFGIGLGLKMEGDMIFHRYPTVELDVGLRAILTTAFAMNMLQDRLSFGVALKGVARGGVASEFSLDTLEAFTGCQGDGEESANCPSLDDFIEGGFGIGADVGMLFTPTKVMEPTLGVSITDLGGTPYEQQDVGGEALGAPPIRLPSVNVGVSAKPWTMGRSYLLTSVDMHAINQPVHFSKKLNMGIEWGYGDIIKVGGGLHQGYLTGGLQFDVGLLNIRVVSYGLELGSAAGDIPDRRYALQMKLLI
jgi:hypothetical protein